MTAILHLLLASGEEIIAATRADDELGSLMQKVNNDNQDLEGYEVCHDCVALNSRLRYQKECCEIACFKSFIFLFMVDTLEFYAFSNGFHIFSHGVD